VVDEQDGRARVGQRSGQLREELGHILVVADIQALQDHGLSHAVHHAEGDPGAIVVTSTSNGAWGRTYENRPKM
jgi:hypothetical protein